MNAAAVAETLDCIDEYVVALRAFIGTTTLPGSADSAEFDELEQCLRMRAADAGAAAATLAADAAVVPSLRDFLGPA
ncbi:MAG: hypothetical protein JWM93_60 [Frankiales bacterium]|nr:hypothetical protein [Frankiales bacterium]